ncbi:MAG: cytochrome P450 [Acidimicrobiales bacterium]
MGEGDAPARGMVDLDLERYLVDGPAELRRCSATAWCAHAVDATGAPLPIVLSHDDVRDVLRDRRLSPRSFTTDMIAAGVSERSARQLTPLFRRHGDEHRAFRGLLSAAFTPRSVERVRPTAAAVAGRLTDAIAARGGDCELVSDLSAPLPPEVFTAVFGLPRSDRDRLAAWGNAVIAAFAPPLTAEQLAAVETTCAQMRDWSLGLIADRRARPADDLVTRLTEAEVDGARLSDDDIVEVITGFVFAGSETTRRQLTAMVVLFSEHPDEWERIAADPALIPGAVEEVLRLRPIVPGMTREAVDPFEQHGLGVEPGGRLVAYFLTANLDAATFDDPDRFWVERPNADAHVTFGWGPHLCVGAPLARLELQEALRAMTARFGPPLLPEGPVTPSELGIVAPDALPVRFPVR